MKQIELREKLESVDSQIAVSPYVGGLMVAVSASHFLDKVKKVLDESGFMVVGTRLGGPGPDWRRVLFVERKG